MSHFESSSWLFLVFFRLWLQTESCSALSFITPAKSNNTILCSKKNVYTKVEKKHWTKRNFQIYMACNIPLMTRTFYEKWWSKSKYMKCDVPLIIVSNITGHIVSANIWEVFSKWMSPLSFQKNFKHGMPQISLSDDFRKEHNWLQDMGTIKEHINIVSILRPTALIIQKT